MEWSPQQEEALQRIEDWHASGTSQVYKLFGYAGSGKTTLAQEVERRIGGHVMFGAFTGKAASVLQSKGCVSASTIHRMIYNSSERSKRRLLELQGELLALEEDEPERRAAIQAEIEREKDLAKQPSFSLNPNSPLRDASLGIFDECSMINNKLGEDICSFDTPILALGDPAQLPPVRGAGFFGRDPDFVLTEVHRQAQGNPIIDMATRVRKRERLPVGSYGQCLVMEGKPDPSVMLEADQIICGKNATRKFCNTKIRKLLGHTDNGDLPVPGDKIVCLRNDYDFGVLNGQIWYVVTCERTYDGEFLVMQIQDDEGDRTIDVVVHPHHFQGRELNHWAARDALEFDYGYALTCHKAQGSQWDNVVILDESYVFQNDRHKWLYTAITRAAESVTVVRR